MMDVLSYALSKKYTDEQISEQKLKVAKVEKEFIDYKQVIAGLNPNQEAKQTAEGYGIVSLPKNAANGQVSVTAKGLTATNIINNGNFANGVIEWTAGYATITASNKLLSVLGDGTLNRAYAYQKLYGTKVIESGRKFFAKLKARVTNSSCQKIKLVLAVEGVIDIVLKEITNPALNQWYDLAGVHTLVDSGVIRVATEQEYIDNATANGKVMEVQEVMAVDLTANGDTETDVNKLAQKYNFVDGTKSTVSAMRLKSVSEDETQESSAYVIATDPDTGEILELRSLPNGVKDEVSVAEGKLYKRVKPYTLKASDIYSVSDYTNVARVQVVLARSGIQNASEWTNNIDNKVDIPYRTEVANNTSYWDIETKIGNIFFTGETSLNFTLPLGTTLEEARQQLTGLTLTYQLAEPIEIPVQVSGSIVSYPNGTIYIERILPDAGVYTDKITILHQGAPIKRLDKLSKVDFMTGVETELDINQAEISEDKLSFTHPELNAGDIVFFEYEYDVESTQGEAEVEYYDSRYTIKDSVTDKFYKWNIVVANGQPSIELVEV